jgi:hypothetical protein
MTRDRLARTPSVEQRTIPLAKAALIVAPATASYETGVKFGAGLRREDEVSFIPSFRR